MASNPTDLQALVYDINFLLGPGYVISKIQACCVFFDDGTS